MKRNFYITVIFMLYGGLSANAQLHLSYNLKQPAQKSILHYVKPYHYRTPRQMDYSNYPLTSEQIEAKTSSVKAYNHFSNLVSNKNGNGFVGNLLGLQRTKLRNNPALPKF